MADAAADCSLCGGTGMRITRDQQGDRVAAVCSCRMARQALSLPVHPHLSDADLDTIVAGVREVLGA